ncbi:MAG: beta-hexosaminidase [Aestuariivita sp.]|nr:beta-hexosaminidase [Aestuariivita sp.]MCY4203206.1 beta-hexosaminidase [Aestuariivita sp.]MCY4289066.1 beta-hexosaminidase [Aestuariivita sp.]MCY4345756.1 beta-hexosaminidase [Aestuariivita sp.]
MQNCRAVILDAEGLRLTSDEKELFRRYDPFGFILFARNLDTADQIRALCAEFRDTVGRNAPILIDQEGGRVARLRPPLVRDWPSPMQQVKMAGHQASQVISLRYRLIAQELRRLGIDCNCAPVVDLAFAVTHDFLKNRCLGSEPSTVTELGREVARAHLDAGVLPVIKHLPGHGRATVDSHYDLPRVSEPLDTLETTDFSTFHGLRDMPLAMTAHVVYDALDSKAPATLSSAALEYARNTIGFDGLILSDDLGMKALGGELSTLAQQAIAAGCDIVLSCNSSLEDREQVAIHAGEMSKEVQERADAALAMRKLGGEVDIPTLEAEFTQLTRELANDGS